MRIDQIVGKGCKDVNGEVSQKCFHEVDIPDFSRISLSYFKGYDIADMSHQKSSQSIDK